MSYGIRTYRVRISKRRLPKKVIKDDKNDLLQNSFSLIFDYLKAE